MKNKLIDILLFWSLLCGTAFAQNGSFTAAVERTTVALGEQFDITFTLSGAGGGRNFHPPSFDDFLTLAGPNQSTNMQFINGTVSSSVSYSYTLQPRAEGVFAIGPATIEYEGKQLETRPIAMTVTKSAPPPKKIQQNQNQQQQDADLGKQIADNLFLKVSVDRSHVYQGEQITATYKLYNRTRLANLSIGKSPAFTGFWSEDLEEIKQVQFTQEVMNGKRYDVAVLKKIALFPQRSGTLEVDPMEINCVIQVQSRRKSNDIFDQFFNDPFFGGGLSNFNRKLRSEPLKITVSPLPVSGIPGGFGGAVGKFSMEAGLDKSQTTTNEPVTLRVMISGSGNLKLLTAPDINFPPDLEKYDPKILDNISHQGDKMSGSRTFEFLLIPRHAGDQRISAFHFSYFDVEKKSYVSLTSPGFLLEVGKGNEFIAAPSSGISKEEVRLLGEDIRFIRSDNVSFRRRGETFAGSLGFYLFSVAPLFAFAALVFVMKRRQELLGDVLSLRSRKARKIAQKRLLEAKKFMDQKKKEAFYAEISRALWGYVADKLSLPPADLSTDAVRSTLGSRGIAEEFILGLTSTIEQCEFARFAPSPDMSQMDGVYTKAVGLISAIEEAL